jgi:hypothetical protein
MATRDDVPNEVPARVLVMPSFVAGSRKAVSRARGRAIGSAAAGWGHNVDRFEAAFVKRGISAKGRRRSHGVSSVLSLGASIARLGDGGH